MMTQTAVYALVAFIALLWTRLGGQTISVALLGPLSTLGSLVIIGLFLFDQLLWKVVPRRVVGRPVIEGTWRVALKSNWLDRPTGEAISPIDGFLVIRQTFSKVEVRLLTAESTSRQVSAHFARLDDDQYCLCAVYRNEPRRELRDRSAIHFGALVLRLPSHGSDVLSGEYWTDRQPQQTGGELRASGRISRRFTDYASAETAFLSRASRRK